MRYGNPTIAGAIDRLRGRGLRPHPRACRSIRNTRRARRRRRSTRCTRTRGRLRRMPALRAIDCFHDDPGLHQGARAERQRLLDEARPARPARAVVPRPAAAHARPGRPLPLPLPEDGAPARARARPRRRAVRGHVPVALRQGRVAASPTRADTLVALAQGGRRRASTSSARASSPTASRRSRRSASRAKQAFLGAGGTEFHAIPCLNEHPLWIAALADLVAAQSAGLARPAARRRGARADAAAGEGAGRAAVTRARPVAAAVDREAVDFMRSPRRAPCRAVRANRVEIAANAPIARSRAPWNDRDGVSMSAQRSR